MLFGLLVLSEESEGSPDVVLLLRLGKREEASKPGKGVRSWTLVSGALEVFKRAHGRSAVPDARRRSGFDCRDADAGLSTWCQLDRLARVVEGRLASSGPFRDECRRAS